MSHWTRARVKIQNPNPEILRQALGVLARELNSEVVENFLVQGWQGGVKANFGIPVPLRYGNGYGVVIRNGQVQVVCDDHGAPLTASQFAAKLTQYYTAIAVAKVAAAQGFTVSLENTKAGVLLNLEVMA